jgi:hypothetical protein
MLELLGLIPVEWLLTAAAAVGAVIFGWTQRRSGKAEGRSLERARSAEVDAAAAAKVREKARAVDDDPLDGDDAEWLRDRFSAPARKPEG